MEPGSRPWVPSSTEDRRVQGAAADGGPPCSAAPLSHCHPSCFLCSGSRMESSFSSEPSVQRSVTQPSCSACFSEPGSPVLRRLAQPPSQCCSCLSSPGHSAPRLFGSYALLSFSDVSQSSYVALTDLNPIIPPPQPPQCWGYDVHPTPGSPCFLVLAWKLGLPWGQAPYSRAAPQTSSFYS